MTRTKSSQSLAIIVLGSLAVSGCAINTPTYGTGESVELGLLRDVTSLATFGQFGKREQPRIQYLERGSLVVPQEIAKADIPKPTSKVDQVDASFPGRAQEIAEQKRKEERKKRPVVQNPFIGSPNAQAVFNTGVEEEVLDTSEEAKKLLADRGEASTVNASIGEDSLARPRESLKTREDLAKELGVPVESLPGAIDEKSILERAGLRQPSSPGRQERLTDVPVEYRTVKTADAGENKDVDALINPKKKKKKRFIFF